MIRRKECDWDPFPVSLMRSMAERRHKRVGGADGLSIGHCSGESLPGEPVTPRRDLVIWEDILYGKQYKVGSAVGLADCMDHLITIVL